MSEVASDIRAFLSIPLPMEVIAKLTGLQKKLREVLNDVAWTRPESSHLTIRFFGNVRAEQLQELQEKIGKICVSAAAFPLRAENIGSFGERVIWAGVNDVSGRLKELVIRLNEITRGFGDHEEVRELHPHLTLGRVKRGSARRGRLGEQLSDWSHEQFGVWTVDHLELMRSELSPEGARHTCLATFPLAGQPDAKERN